MAELGGGGSRTLTSMLAIEYPNPGWAIKNYLNDGQTQVGGESIRYRRTTYNATPCNYTHNNGTRIHIDQPLTVFDMQEWNAVNDVIDGEESNRACGKFKVTSIGGTSQNAAAYMLSYYSDGLPDF